MPEHSAKQGSGKNHYRFESKYIELRRKLRFTGFEYLTYLRVLRRKRLETKFFLKPCESASAVTAHIRERHSLTFCVTSGRTGSDFLCRLMGQIPETSSLHEPEPAFQRFHRAAMRDPQVAKDFWLSYKLPFIINNSERNYVETSNVFGKGFVEPLLDLGVVPNIILLSRSPRKIARSYLERYVIPGRTKLGFEYLVSPSDPGTLKINDWRGLSDYQICFWYALEMERRQDVYQEEIARRGGKVFETTAARLNDENEYVNLIRALDLVQDPEHIENARAAHRNLSGIPVNKNYRTMEYFGDADQEEAEVWARIHPDYHYLRDKIEQKYARLSKPAST